MCIKCFLEWMKLKKWTNKPIIPEQYKHIFIKVANKIKITL